MSFTIALVGRPNVGKSTLFNRLTGKKYALVDPTPGLTRDRREGEVELGDLSFTLLDTAGLEKAETGSLQAAMMQSTQTAIDSADMVLFLIDGREGLLPVDEDFAKQIRRQGKPTLMLANKCEGKKADARLHEAIRLGFGEPLMISAEQGFGMDELEIALKSIQEKYHFEAETYNVSSDDKGLQLAVVGRPNAGKSTLFNALIGEDRAIVSDVPGTTRDAVAVDTVFDDHPIKLVDTAGLRKQSKRTKDKVEKLAVDDSFRAIQYANVVILLVDGTAPLEKVELQIASHVLEEGRALVIAVNKWDQVEEKKHTLEEIDYRLEVQLAQAKAVPLVTISALKQKGLKPLMQEVLRIYQLWNARISTGKLNRWLERATSKHVPPLAQGQRIRLKYVTQVKSRPPTFAVFTTSRVKDLPDSYIRYLINDLREYFDFQGVPVRMHIRKQANPYEGRKKRSNR